MNKLQIRAEVLSIVKNIQSINFQNKELLAQTVENLEKIDDKKTLTDIIIKEVFSAAKNTSDVLIFLLFSSIDKNIIEERLWEILRDSNVADAHKFIVIGILKDIGTPVTYDALTEFVTSKDEFVDFETQKLLEVAVLNPEAQIDFLDFIFTIDEEDQKLLLNSLTEDFEGDILANILSPIILSKPHSKIAQIAIAALEKTKSPFALNTLDWVVKNIKKDEIVSLAKKAINVLKLQGIRTLYTSKELHAGLLKHTTAHKCYISIPDGNGNYGVIFSRIYENSNLQMFAAVVNTRWGIVDCFGFNEISTSEFNRILSKFYPRSESINIPLGQIKKLLSQAEMTAIQKTNRLSYEYACWHVLLDDIEENEIVYDFEKVELNDDAVKKLYETGFLDTWFMEAGDNEKFDEFLEKTPDFESIEKLFDEYFSLIFCDEVLEFYNEKMLLSAHFIKLMGHANISGILYSLLHDEKRKKIFFKEIFKKSIYEFYLSKRARIKELQKKKNIFLKVNKENSDILCINEMIEKIEKAWI